MPEKFDVETVREVTDVNDGGDLVDYWEVEIKTKPSGVVARVRVPASEGSDAAIAAAEAKALELEKIAGLKG
jgi:hypothetical protein